MTWHVSVGDMIQYYSTAGVEKSEFVYHIIGERE